MDRASTLSRLKRINDMSDDEIAINAKWIKEVANAAHLHIIQLRKDREKIKRKQA